MTLPILTAAVVQFECVAGDKAANFSTMRQFVDQASAHNVQLLVFPEMCIPGYWHLTKMTAAQLHSIAESATGPSINQVKSMAAEAGIAIGAGWLESSDGKLYNSYAVCFPDGTVHVHRKLHAFEHREISSGDSFTVFDTPWGIRAGILICWDNNLVENVRANALAGVQMLIAPHQTGGTRSRSPHGMKPIAIEKWENRFADPAAIEAEIKGPNGREWLMRWLPARAHDNGLFVLFSNGVGRDDDEVRTGNAMIIDPYGRIVAETWQAGDDIVVADLDFSLVPMSTGQRWLRGRRPELYAQLTRRRGDELPAFEARFSEE